MLRDPAETVFINVLQDKLKSSQTSFQFHSSHLVSL